MVIASGEAVIIIARKFQSALPAVISTKADHAWTNQNPLGRISLYTFVTILKTDRNPCTQLERHFVPRKGLGDDSRQDSHETLPSHIGTSGQLQCPLPTMGPRVVESHRGSIRESERGAQPLAQHLAALTCFNDA